MTEPLIFELSSPGRVGCDIPTADLPEDFLTVKLSKEHTRSTPPGLPEVDELTVVRHFTRLSQMNYSVDTNFYPLGSCTMKYNPKSNDEVAALPGMSMIHPLQDPQTVQGLLRLLYDLQRHLAEIGGLAEVSLQPSAGAQGEFTGLLVMQAFYRERGEGMRRRRIIVPDSAHGTNPASAARCGYSVTQVKSGPDGCVDLCAVEQALGDDVACLMVTNPNTLGIFEKDVQKLADMIHASGAFLYLDGANMNAIVGKAKPGAMGCDVMHFNLHKTFSTPHGGGGPGAGPIAVTEALAPYLPVPVISRSSDGIYHFDHNRPRSIGKLHGFYGNVGVLVRAYAYIRQLGKEGLTRLSEDAVLNANYLLSRLAFSYQRTSEGLCKHEFVVSASHLKKDADVSALDVAKRLLDYGFYAPTIYFPLIVKEAIMIEPTETESKETLDRFAEAMNAIAGEARNNPALLHDAPYTAPVRRLEEARAARELNVCFSPACQIDE